MWSDVPSTLAFVLKSALEVGKDLQLALPPFAYLVALKRGWSDKANFVSCYFRIDTDISLVLCEASSPGGSEAKWCCL